MGIVKEAMIGALDLVDHSDKNYVGWTLNDENYPDLNTFVKFLMADYPDEFEVMAESKYDGYDAKAIEFLYTSNNKTYCFDYFVDDFKTRCELFEIQNQKDQAYLEL